VSDGSLRLGSWIAGLGGIRRVEPDRPSGAWSQEHDLDLERREIPGSPAGIAQPEHQVRRLLDRTLSAVKRGDRMQDWRATTRAGISAVERYRRMVGKVATHTG